MTLAAVLVKKISIFTISVSVVENNTLLLFCASKQLSIFST